MNKEKIKIKEKQLLDLTAEFCDQYLDEEYKQLCGKLIKKLGRKRNVPFQSGKIEIWAAAVIHALGTINFLFDKSAEPFITVQDISTFFGTKNSTVSGKAKQIRDLFKMRHFDLEFSTQKISKNNPLNNFVMVNGLIVPLSSIPEDLQELVKRERAEGRDISFSTDAEE